MGRERAKNDQNLKKMQFFRLSQPRNQPKMKFFKFHAFKFKIYLKSCHKLIYSLFWPFSWRREIWKVNFGTILGHFSSVNADFSRVRPSQQQPQKSNRLEIGGKWARFGILICKATTYIVRTPPPFLKGGDRPLKKGQEGVGSEFSHWKGWDSRRGGID